MLIISSVLCIRSRSRAFQKSQQQQSKISSDFYKQLVHFNLCQDAITNKVLHKKCVRYFFCYICKSDISHKHRQTVGNCSKEIKLSLGHRKTGKAIKKVKKKKIMETIPFLLFTSTKVINVSWRNFVLMYYLFIFYYYILSDQFHVYFENCINSEISPSAFPDLVYTYICRYTYVCMCDNVYLKKKEHFTLKQP